MLQRTFYLLIICALCLGFIACGGSKTDPTPTDAPTDAPTANASEAPAVTSQATISPAPETESPVTATPAAFTASPAPTATVTIAATNVPTATMRATARPTSVPTATPTLAPTAVPTATSSPTPAPTPQPTATAVPEKVSYTVVCVDQNGNPVSGVIVTFCTDSLCKPLTTGANGMASHSDVPYEYDLHVVVIPTGYTINGSPDAKASMWGGTTTFTFTKGE